jgi:phosphoglycolate phosphatase
LSAAAAEVVLFDLDGVIADSQRAITSCMNAALEACGYSARPEDELRRFIGPSLSFGFAELMGVDPEDPAVAAGVHAYRERYAEVFVEETPAYPGVVEAIDALAGGGRRLGVATSKPRRFAEPLLEALGAMGFFEVVAAPGLDVHVESKTETVAEAIAALGGVERGAMVGDRHVDMRAAKVHGLRGVGALWGFGGEAELRDAGADVLVGAPAGLVDVFS